MTAHLTLLTVKLKSFGFAIGTRMKLYGEIFEMASDPMVVNDNVVLIDAIETKSGKLQRVRIPLPILKMATERVA